MRDGWEILIDPPMPRRAVKFMDAMAAAKPPGSDVNALYRGDRRLLMMYGPGAPRRMPIIKAHLAAGGRVAMWDLGYWNRETAMRLSIDALHPKPEHLAMAPAARRAFVLREDSKPDGPVLLIGLGAKSVFAYGIKAPMVWERARLKELRRRVPERQIHWRPKGDKPTPPLPGTVMAHSMTIEKALRGCSLVVCRHSNVAVDACVAGIPVECEDGAALALYRDNPAPTAEQRMEFLGRLSWFEWDRSEAPAAWAWVQNVCA